MANYESNAIFSVLFAFAIEDSLNATLNIIYIRNNATDG